MQDDNTPITDADLEAAAGGASGQWVPRDGKMMWEIDWGNNRKTWTDRRTTNENGRLQGFTHNGTHEVEITPRR